MHEQLLDEIRAEFQIPPFFPDESLNNYVVEGMAWLGCLNPGKNIEDDKIFRSLLKNYVYYAYHHKINEYQENYAGLILSWQLGSEVPDEGTA